MGYTPCVSIDGYSASSSPSSYAASINARLAVPSYVSIGVNCVGDETGGTAYFSVTAEQDLDTGVKLWTVILEDHEIATSAWGGYNGQEMMWIPVVAPTPTSGTVLNFTGPYPQTIEVQGNYTLIPSQHPIENLNVAAIVQGYQSNSEKEVFNAFFEPYPMSGVAEDETSFINSNALLGAYPNPSTGTFSISSILPDGVTGTIEVFDVAGRSIEQRSAGSIQNMHIEGTGLYFVRLTTSTGEILSRQVAVIR